MAAFRIAVLGGDGIGPEVIDEAIQVADAALRREAGATWNGTVCPGTPPSTRKPAR